MTTQRNIYLAVTTAAGGFALAACSALRQVETTPKADVLVLTSTYSIQENLGPSPVEVTSTENLARYRIERKKKPPEFLLVLFPEKLGGPIPLKLHDGMQGGETAVYGSYFDQLLRAHRLVLKGALAEADALITRIQTQYDDGFGTAILRGNIALLRGEQDAAVRQFRYAKGLVPEAPVAKDLMPGESGEAP